MAYTVKTVDWQSKREFVKRIRERVFVFEYRIPASAEFDHLDVSSDHILLLDGEQPIATGRLDKFANIGRIAILPSHRNQTVANIIIEHLLAIAKEKGLEQVTINTDLNRVDHYQEKGFCPSSKVFMEQGIAKQKLASPISNFTLSGAILH